MVIKSEDISVVVQGAIDKTTKKCLKSIRKYLPQSEIILSTWEGSNIKGLKYDILVESKDPGGVLICPKTKLYNNLNRQLVSTQNGLKKVNRKYTMKFRTDFYLRGKDFLNYFDKFPVRDEKYSVFKHRVIVAAVYSRLTSEQGIPTPFHPSDFFFFGLTEDIKSYFEQTPLEKEENMTNYNYLYLEKKPYHINTLTERYAPEQYFCLKFLQRHFSDIKFDDWTDWNDENIEFSKNIDVNNFIYLGFPESGIFSDKHWQALLYETKTNPGIITYQIFKEMYKEMLDKNFDTSISRFDDFIRKKNLFSAAIFKGRESLYYRFF